MTGVKLGLEQDLHLNQHAQQRQWPPIWLSDCRTDGAIFSVRSPSPVSPFQRSAQQTDGRRGKQLKVKKALKANIWATSRAGGRGVGAQLQHQCLLMCGPIRELLDVVWTKQIVAVCVQRVRVIVGRTWGAKKHTHGAQNTHVNMNWQKWKGTSKLLSVHSMLLFTHVDICLTHLISLLRWAEKDALISHNLQTPHFVLN